MTLKEIPEAILGLGMLLIPGIFAMVLGILILKDRPDKAEKVIIGIMFFLAVIIFIFCGSIIWELIGGLG